MRRRWRLAVLGLAPLLAQAAIRIPGVIMVRTDDLARKPDGIHLSTPGQMILGRRLAQAMHRLFSRQPPDGVSACQGVLPRRLQFPGSRWTFRQSPLE